MKVIHRGKLRRVNFTLAAGDIFDASVDAIVNSEQTYFISFRKSEVTERPDSEPVRRRCTRRTGGGD